MDTKDIVDTVNLVIDSFKSIFRQEIPSGDLSPVDAYDENVDSFLITGINS